MHVLWQLKYNPSELFHEVIHGSEEIVILGDRHHIVSEHEVLALNQARQQGILLPVVSF